MRRRLFVRINVDATELWEESGREEVEGPLVNRAGDEGESSKVWKMEKRRWRGTVNGAVEQMKSTKLLELSQIVDVNRSAVDAEIDDLRNAAEQLRERRRVGRGLRVDEHVFHSVHRSSSLLCDLQKFLRRVLCAYIDPFDELRLTCCAPGRVEERIRFECRVAEL